MQDNRLFHYKL